MIVWGKGRMLKKETKQCTIWVLRKVSILWKYMYKVIWSCVEQFTLFMSFLGFTCTIGLNSISLPNHKILALIELEGFADDN